MNYTSTDLEALLHAAYVQEADCYARAEQWAGELATACGRGEPIGDRLRPVLDLLEEVAAHESRIASAKQHWRRSDSRSESATLRSVMDRIAALIEQLRRHLQKIERSACERRDQLAVELDACNRRCRMQRAYSRES